jgi:hypothetical protein
MEQIPTPKKERKFLKSIVRVAGVLVQELALGLGRKYIGKMINKIKIPKKRETLSFLLLLSCTFAFAQYPATGNKQRLGYQSTGDGLVFRGRASDTTALKPSTINNAYHLFDTLNNVLFSYIKTKGGWQFNNSDTVIIQGVTMPFDSITFNTAKNGTVGVGEVEYNDTQGSLIQGLKGGLVTNVIGQQLHQRVNNQTGSTLAKGTAVYLSGSQGNRITVAKALGVTDAFSANTFGIVAESIDHNQSGYVITEGLITNINTSALTEDSAVYLSPTVAGGLTSTKPQAPQHTVYIGVCVKSNAGSGELFVKIRNGQELDELHDVRISNPSNNSSLYYKLNEKLWRDTTAALLVSDTASMLTPYFKKLDTTSLNLVSRFATKLNISDTSSMLTNYLRTGVAAATYQTKLTNPITGTGTTNYLPKFTGTTALGNSTIFDNGNIGIGNNSPTVAIDLLKSTSSTSAKIRLSTEFASAIRTLNIGSGDGITWDIPSSTSQSPYIDVIGGDNSVGGGNFYIKTQGTEKFTVRQNGNIGINILTPSYKLDVSGTFNASGNSLIGGTLGVTGATTLSNLAGSGTRMVTASSLGLLSTQSIPTGTVTIVSAASPNPNGLTVATGTTTPVISMALAGSGTIGVVSATTQTFGGDKTFNGIVNANSDLNVTGLSTLTGGVSIGTMSTQSALTNILGVNSSNTIGEIGLNSVFSLSSGVLNIQEAGSSQRGIVTATTQSFGGDKTFTDKVGFTKAIQRPIATISGNTTIQTSNCWIIVNNTGGTTTLTLPDATLATGTELMIKTAQAQAVISASSNVVPLTFANTASTSILPATDGAWCTLVSNGTFWVIMASN